MDITVTASAEKFIKRMVRFGGIPNAGFRMSVSPGGCSGLSAEFSVEAEPKEGEATVTVSGIKFFFPAESRLLLQGYTIDFSETPTSSGFVFTNPNAAGCGSCSSSAPAGAPGTASVSISSIQVKHSH